MCGSCGLAKQCNYDGGRNANNGYIESEATKETLEKLAPWERTRHA